MNILKKISGNFRIDASESGSTEMEINNLIDFSKINIPNEYIEIIKELSLLEINVDEEKYIRIWGANDCIEMNEIHYIQNFIPNSLAIADDEEGNALIYTTGNKGFGLYIIAFNDLDVNELQYVAKSLSDLLTKNVGIDVIKSC
ncbi:MAG: SMI1/KNR4 family protein [Carboxylicivirga sp.]|jgi:hypothetical protein|nr:SMI1/KNR4 family protein [Carboxylicivirga sp.]